MEEGEGEDEGKETQVGRGWEENQNTQAGRLMQGGDADTGGGDYENEEGEEEGEVEGAGAK